MKSQEIEKFEAELHRAVSAFVHDVIDQNGMWPTKNPLNRTREKWWRDFCRWAKPRFVEATRGETE